MAIKMRVLYASKKGKIATMASMIKAEYDLAINAVDKIPPAYSCDKERIVILMLSLKGEPDDQLRLFCQELTKVRAQNVALIIDGTEAAATRMKEILKTAGTNVADEVLFVKCGLFSKAVSDEEKAALLAFTHRIVDNLQ
ncbi:MAG: hypothetical protein E7663_00805 [Ruminococcaceae bacterium]|nr:hypothetical protein [Oscillospiraceae bacterium]